MKLPQRLRTLAALFLMVGLVSLFGNILLAIFLDDSLIPLFQLPRTTVALIIATGSFGLMLAALVGSIVLGNVAHERLRRSGLAARAKVLAVADTGITMNKNPVARIKLEVYPPGGPAFEAVAEELISRLEVGSISPGVEVTVRYNPTTREVALERAK